MIQGATLKSDFKGSVKKVGGALGGRYEGVRRGRAELLNITGKGRHRGEEVFSHFRLNFREASQGRK
jgi:hypothetical protein